MSNTNPLGRKPLRHRLPEYSYATFGSTWHVKFGTFDRQRRVFENPELALAVLETLRTRVGF